MFVETRWGSVLPDWRDFVCSALDFWINAEGGPDRTGKPLRIGPAHGTSPGWYTVDLRGSRLGGIDQVESLRLAGPAGPESAPSYAVLEAVQDGETIRIRVPEFAELGEPQLWRAKQSTNHLLVKLREGIAELDDAGLAHELAAGRLVPAPSSTKHVSGFIAGQDAAYSACLERGVHLVWGPPGTGKTRVLTEAIDTLLRAGKRVLLVSSTNIAVDNALLGAIQSRRHRSGDLLRVGPPHHPEVLDHSEVCLPALVGERLEAIARARADVERQLAEMRADREELDHLEQALIDFDAPAYHQAQPLVAAAASIPGLAVRAAHAGDELRRLEAQLAATRTRYTAAEVAWQELEPARRAYQEIDRLRRKLAELRAAADELRAEEIRSRHKAGFIGSEVRELADGGWAQRIRNRGRLRTLTDELTHAETSADELRQRAQDAAQLVERQQQQTDRRCRELTGSVRVGLPELRQVETDLRAAERELARHTEAAAAARTTLQDAQRKLLDAEAAAPTEEQRTMIEDAERRGLPGLHAQTQLLRERIKASADERGRLERQYTKIHDQYIRLSRDAEGEIIRGARLVATTLARLRISKPLMDGPYDVVLVDEVGAAHLAEVLLAVSRATQAAVLFGDFMQLSAILDNKQVSETDRADVQQWLLPDVFAHCGIFSPSDAQRHAGCTVLAVQHRFGPEIMALANAIAYDGLLNHGDSIRPHAPNDPEIILLDVDKMGDIGRVRPDGRYKGWWPAGALLARVLADYHRARGENAGIVTPYGRQVDATLEALRDHEAHGSALAEVGTAHRFQGRQFPIVIFDTVEDEYGDRWMANANRTGDTFRRDGIRLFNVAVTRAQHRLYVIGSRKKIEAAKAGTPFGHLAAMIRQQRARVVRANRLVTPTSTPDDELARLAATFTGELAELLAEHVRVTDIHDERTFYEALDGHLTTAERSIWLWAPWTTTRVKQMAPLLRDAVDRGVWVTLFVRDPGDQGATKARTPTVSGRPAVGSAERCRGQRDASEDPGDRREDGRVGQSERAVAELDPRGDGDHARGPLRAEAPAARTRQGLLTAASMRRARAPQGRSSTPPERPMVLALLLGTMPAVVRKRT